MPAASHPAAEPAALIGECFGSLVQHVHFHPREEAVLAASRAVVTVEEVVERLTPGTNAVVLPSWTVGAIAVVPGGAHPSYAHGYYARDNAFYVAWDAISRDRAAFKAWMDEHVLGVDAAVFHRRAYAAGPS